MDERLVHLLGAAGPAHLDRIAVEATGIDGVTCAATPRYDELKATRADYRTLGIVRVSGDSTRADGSPGPAWSAVAKVVDLAEAQVGEVSWTRPEIEEIVYEEGYFADDGLSFRPVRCHAVSRPEPTVKVFWLEDLTDADQAPFGLEQLAEMARHLGEWSGFHRTPPDLKFPLVVDIFAARWRQPALLARHERMAAVDPVLLRRWYGDVPVAALAELRSLLLAQNEPARTLPHGLAFGDCQVGNLFHRPGETIAVDWASLASDPIGADAGSMIGSMLGRAGLLEVARNERMLFDCYIEGLVASGWRGDRDDVRRGYFCQYGHYIATTVGLFPVVFANGEWPRGEMERRLQADWDDFPELMAPLIAMYPAYIEELRALAAR